MVSNPRGYIEPEHKKIYARVSKSCKYCNSKKIVKDGFKNTIQQYKCNSCGHKFLDNQRYPKMKNEKKIIATAIDLFYNGLSLRKVVLQIRRIFGVAVSHVSIYNWIQKYIPIVKKFTKALKPNCVGGEWHNDETMIKVGGEYAYYWDIIDYGTKFLLDGFSSGRRRNYKQARNLYKNAKDYVDGLPSDIYCDGYPGYEKGIRASFNRNHIRFHSKIAICTKKNNNSIERWHSTLKTRLKTMRGLQNPKALLDGFITYYNFLRPHQSLKGKTPAQAAGINLPFENGAWDELIEWATHYKNINQTNSSHS